MNKFVVFQRTSDQRYGFRRLLSHERVVKAVTRPSGESSHIMSEGGTFLEYFVIPIAEVDSWTEAARIKLEMETVSEVLQS